jgi:geranylgeranyl diphosphate synthase type I
MLMDALKAEVDVKVEEVLSTRIAELRRCGADPFLVSLYEKIRLFASNAGKRLRPVSCLMAHAACGGKAADREAVLDVAVAFELLHNSTLVHDDVMDEDALRRGKPTVWKMLADEFAAQPTPATEHHGMLFGSASALHCVTHGILAGNLLVGEAMRLATARPDAAAVVPLFVEAYLVVNHGQVLDISGKTGEREYATMSEKKTGWLFRCAILAGATLAGATRE